MSFFVTAIAYYPEDERCNAPYKHNQTFGHWPDLSAAQRAVANNEGDMNECLYNYLVIEEIAYGVYGRLQLQDPDDQTKGEWWYEWKQWKPSPGQDPISHWVPIIKPQWSYGIIGWGC